MLQEGKRVKVKSKEQLLKECGADAHGYPNTRCAINYDGEMDHLFGATGVIIKISKPKDYMYIFIFFDKGLNPNKAQWVFSEDMLEEI